MGSTGSRKFSGKKYNDTLRSVEDRIRPQSTESLVVIDGDGDVLLDKTSGAVDFVRVSPSEIPLLKDATVTHNHPSGRTFSHQDIDLLVRTMARELRAVGSTGSTYSLIRNPGVAAGSTFSSDYTDAAAQYMSNVVDPIWNSSQQTSADAARCNAMVNEYRRKWLKANAKSYGYTYTERKGK